VRDLVGDVLVQDLLELWVGERALRQPRRQLAVPDERVAAHDLAMGAGEGDEPIGRREVERAALGLDALPLHRVLGRDAVELTREHARVGRVVAQRVVGDRGADQRARREVAQPAGLVGLRGGDSDQQRHDGGEHGP
jgi:hypothetical protein